MTTNKLEVANCAGCGKMYRPEGLAIKLCPDCLQEYEGMLREVKETIKANPGMNAYEISKRTGISYSLILDCLLDYIRHTPGLDGCGFGMDGRRLRTEWLRFPPGLSLEGL